VAGLQTGAVAKSVAVKS